MKYNELLMLPGSLLGENGKLLESRRVCRGKKPTLPDLLSNCFSFKLEVENEKGSYTFYRHAFNGVICEHGLLHSCNRTVFRNNNVC